MISFRCPTYGRVAFLEEALQSFLLQEENDAELVIVNDYPLQTLIFDHPQVRIFNLKETFPIIGEKENFTIEQCKGDLIGTFDDDDIAMPWHLKNIKKYFTPGTNILHWGRGVYYNEPVITQVTTITNAGMVFSKDAWERAGRSPLMNAGGDTEFAKNMHKLGGVTNAYPPTNEESYFYRWSLPTNGGVFHQSGAGYDVPGRPNIVQRHGAFIEGLRIKGIIPTGDIVLKPKWRHDYKKMLYDFNEKRS